MLAFVLLTAGNAFFVAAEFSLVTVDRAAVDQGVAEGDPTARKVHTALRELSFQLSGAQLGITITALLTGYLAEPALAKLFAPILRGLGDAAAGVSHILALGLATLLSMLFGELVPKNAAISRPMRIARMTAAPMRGFSTALGWLIRILNGSANWLVRRLGVEPQEELASARSPEELGLLAAYSAKAGALPEDTALLLQRTIRFGEKRAAEAMTPRVDVIGIEATKTVQTAIDRILDEGVSRLPVYEENLDRVVGVVTVTELLSVALPARASTPVGEVAREHVEVPESVSLDVVLATLQDAGQDLAVVVDEYGGTDGVVTLEDLVEELVGEIADEYDSPDTGFTVVWAPPGAAAHDENGAVVAGGERTWLLDGVLREDEVAEITGFRLPEGPYETLAGFLLARLGHIPAEDESVLEHGWRFTVDKVERRRIEQVRVVGPPEALDG